MLAEVTNNSAATNVPVASLAAIILGLVTPFIISCLKQPNMDQDKRRIISIAAAIVIGVLNLVVQGAAFDWHWTWAGAVTNLVLVIGASQTAYSALWKPTGVADTVERATSPKQP